MKLWTSTKELKGGFVMWTWWKGRKKIAYMMYYPKTCKKLGIIGRGFVLGEGFTFYEPIAGTFGPLWGKGIHDGDMRRTGLNIEEKSDFII